MSAPLTASTLVTSMLVRGLSLDRQAPLLKFHTFTSPLSQPGQGGAGQRGGGREHMCGQAVPVMTCMSHEAVSTESHSRRLVEKP